MDTVHALAPALLLPGLRKTPTRGLLCQACPRWRTAGLVRPAPCTSLIYLGPREMLIAKPRCLPRPAQPQHFGMVLQYPQLRSSAEQCLQLSLPGQQAVHALISAVLAGQAAAQGTAFFQRSCETIFSQSRHSCMELEELQSCFPQ